MKSKYYPTLAIPSTIICPNFFVLSSSSLPSNLSSYSGDTAKSPATFCSTMDISISTFLSFLARTALLCFPIFFLSQAGTFLISCFVKTGILFWALILFVSVSEPYPAVSTQQFLWAFFLLMSLSPAVSAEYSLCSSFHRISLVSWPDLIKARQPAARLPGAYGVK